MRSQADAAIAPERRTLPSTLEQRPQLLVIMTNTESVHATATAHEAINRLSIHQRAGVWRIALNGDFYGDYVRRFWALETAFEKAEAIAASGGAATITWAVDGEQDAVLYDTRRPAPRENAARAFEWPARAAGSWNV